MPKEVLMCINYKYPPENARIQQLGKNYVKSNKFSERKRLKIFKRDRYYLFNL